MKRRWRKTMGGVWLGGRAGGGRLKGETSFTRTAIGIIISLSPPINFQRYYFAYEVKQSIKNKSSVVVVRRGVMSLLLVPIAHLHLSSMLLLLLHTRQTDGHQVRLWHCNNLTTYWVCSATTTAFVLATTPRVARARDSERINKLIFKRCRSFI
jgi:hypothetical protein